MRGPLSRSLAFVAALSLAATSLVSACSSSSPEHETADAAPDAAHADGASDAGQDGTTGQDSGPAVDSAVDSTVPPEDTSVDTSAAPDTTVSPDSAPVEDSAFPDTAPPVDSAVADTEVPDTAVPPDTSVADSGVADSGVADTGLPDSEPADSGAPDSAPETSADSASSLDAADGGGDGGDGGDGGERGDGSDGSDGAAATFTVGGTVTGLPVTDQVGLQNDGGVTYFVTANGNFAFPTRVASGASYDVTVEGATAGIQCTVAGGTGTVGSGNVTSVAVTCAPLVSGTVTGLDAGESLTLVVNGQNNLIVGTGAASQPFSLANGLGVGQAYDVTVGNLPSTCAVTANGSGTTGTPGATSVAVTCTTWALVPGVTGPVSVAISPNTNATPYVIYVATSGSGIFASADAISFTSATPATTVAVAAMPNSNASFASLPDGTVDSTMNSGSSWGATGGSPNAVINGWIGIGGVGPLGASANVAGRAVVFQGKMNGANWAPSAAFGTGSATSLAFGGGASPNAIVYAAVNGSAGGVFKSVNVGTTPFTFASTGFPQTDVLSVATAPSSLATVYAGTNGEGVYLSPNSGGTWSAASSGLTNQIVQALAVDPTNASNVYAGTMAGVYVSKDGATTWKLSGIATGSVTSLAVLNGSPNIVFAATSTGLYFTITGGS
jgi:hypothetical protein